MKVADSCVCCESTHLQKTPAILMPFLAKRIFGWDPIEVSPDWGIRDLKPGHGYAICNTVCCLSCNVLFLDMRFDAQEMGHLYRDYRGEEYERLRTAFEPGYRERNNSLRGESDYIPKIEACILKYIDVPHSVLDWGGDTGLNTPFRKLAKQHFVYDISDKQLVAGACKASIEDCSKVTYDLVVSSNVLEHVSYPKQHIKQIVEVMSRSTVLYLEVPYEDIMRENEDSRFVAKNKRHWHEHINFFSEKSLRILLESCGLELFALEANEIVVGGRSAVVHSILSRLR